MPCRTSAVVLAAGRGSRLGALTNERPKCLVSVAGRTILEWQMSALSACGVNDVLVVTGYRHVDVEEALKVMALRLDIRVVRNVNYETTGTAASVQLGLSAIDQGTDVLILEGDVVFDPTLLREFLLSRTESGTALASWRPSYSGTCAVVDSGRVVAWLHESQQPQGFRPHAHFKTVNITWLPSKVWTDGFLPAVCRTLSTDGVRSPAEYAFQNLVQSGLWPVQAMLTDRWNWWEVDTPEDLTAASEMFDVAMLGKVTGSR